MTYNWLELSKRLQSIAQTGLTYCENKYDIDRYEQLRNISVEILETFTDEPVEKIRRLFTNEIGYQTPKVDVRAVVFRERKILLVQETVDNCWSLPGGWADIGISPFDTAAKETLEESGLLVKPIRLLAVLDYLKQNMPPSAHHCYKMFVLCHETGGELKAGMETLDSQFFELENLPTLSPGRNSESQIRLMYRYLDNPNLETICE